MSTISSNHCSGPWIENQWISTFCCDKPLSVFGPFIPLFIQWVDIGSLSSQLYQHLHQILKSTLRPDVLYISVSQHDQGISAAFFADDLEDAPYLR